MILNEKQIKWIGEHIQLNCDSSNKDYAWLSNGIIISDDDNGKKLTLAKESLKYDELKAAGKVNEITIDQSWDIILERTEIHKEDNYLECWNNLVTAAYKANHGLLVINITNIKIFEHCWHLKQLAKQECEMQIWQKDYSGIISYNMGELIEGFLFDGYVLLVINNVAWDEVKKHAIENNLGQFDAMMQFYSHVSFDE